MSTTKNSPRLAKSSERELLVIKPILKTGGAATSHANSPVEPSSPSGLRTRRASIVKGQVSPAKRPPRAHSNKLRVYGENDLDGESDTESIRLIKRKRRKHARAKYRDQVAKEYEGRPAVDDSFTHFLGHHLQAGAGQQQPKGSLAKVELFPSASKRSSA